MKTLQLVLKRKWYDMITSGEKKEEYREITPYWAKRITQYFDYPKGYEIDAQMRHVMRSYLDGREIFDGVMFYHGYSKYRDRMFCKINSITIGTGNPDWGAEPGKQYFVIRITPQWGETLRLESEVRRIGK